MGPGAPAPVPGGGRLPRPLTTLAGINAAAPDARGAAHLFTDQSRYAKHLARERHHNDWTNCIPATPARLAAPTPARDRRRRRAAALLLRLGCAALLAWIGYIHLHLWQEGYRHIPTNGPLFLLDAVAGFALAAVLLAWPRPLAGLLAAGYTASTLGALIISLSVGLFGFRESISASFVTESLTIESITVLALISWTVLVAATLRPPARGPRPVARPGPSDSDSRAVL